MAPGEFVQDATIDERSTVFTWAAPPFVLLSRGQRGEQDRDLWRVGDALFQVARTAARPADRCQPSPGCSARGRTPGGKERPRPG
jgi:hypothetical protein